MRSAAALKLGCGYGLLAFAVGFPLGAARTLLVAPRTGALAAVALELPIMLLATGWLAAQLTRRFRPSRAEAALIGAAAFASLMLCEIMLAGAMGVPLAGWVAGLGTPAGSLGLAGQVAFALYPLAFAALSRTGR